MIIIDLNHILYLLLVQCVRNELCADNNCMAKPVDIHAPATCCWKLHHHLPWCSQNFPVLYPSVSHICNSIRPWLPYAFWIPGTLINFSLRKYFFFVISINCWISKEPFQNVSDALLKTLVMMSGEFDYGSIFLKNSGNGPVPFPGISYTGGKLILSHVILVHISRVN